MRGGRYRHQSNSCSCQRDGLGGRRGVIGDNDVSRPRTERSGLKGDGYDTAIACGYQSSASVGLGEVAARHNTGDAQSSSSTRVVEGHGLASAAPAHRHGTIGDRGVGQSHDLGLRCFHRGCEQEEKRDEKHTSWNVRRTERWFHTTSCRREMMKYFETGPGIHASTWLFGRLCPVSPWKEERLERRIGANDCGLFGSAST